MKRPRKPAHTGASAAAPLPGAAPLGKGAAHVIGKVVSSAISSGLSRSAGSTGALGSVAGMVIKRVAKRSPAGAVLLGGAYVAHKLYRRKKERDEDTAASKARPIGPAPTDKLPPSGK